MSGASCDRGGPLDDLPQHARGVRGQVLFDAPEARATQLGSDGWIVTEALHVPCDTDHVVLLDEEARVP